jgi:diguanylate cyclase (GGDEF)-like protein
LRKMSKDRKSAKSKPAMAITLWGWLLFGAWLAYDYVEYGDRLLIHIFRQHATYEETVFHVLIILVPFVCSVLGYIVNERMKLLTRLKESEKYHSVTIVDDLTNLLNRRGFFFLSDQQLKMAKRKEKGALLIYADFDNLKRINDTFGHKAGDKALLNVAEIIRATFRKSDIIARIGGDEFSVLAMETSWASADTLVSRLRENVRSYHATTYPYKLSLSIGLSYYDPETPCSLEELIERADKYLRVEMK